MSQQITRQKLRDIFLQAVVQWPAVCRVVFHCQVILNVPVSSGVCFYSEYICVILFYHAVMTELIEMIFDLTDF